MMTTQSDFQKYHSLQRKLATEIRVTMNSERYTKLMELQRRCFPTKEQVIEELEAFFDDEGSQ